jgi:hypothetical protein
MPMRVIHIAAKGRGYSYQISRRRDRGLDSFHRNPFSDPRRQRVHRSQQSCQHDSTIVLHILNNLQRPPKLGRKKSFDAVLGSAQRNAAEDRVVCI